MLLTEKKLSEQQRVTQQYNQIAAKADGNGVVDRHQLATLARHLIILSVSSGSPVDSKWVHDALSAYPGEGPLSTFFRELTTPTTSEISLKIARAAREKWPNSQVSIHYYANYYFDNGDIDRAVQILEESLDTVKRHDFLANLYIKSLEAAGRGRDGLEFILKFFEFYNGDMWRSSNFIDRQAAACRKGMPPVLVITQAKSGSLFILNTLEKGLETPSTYLTPLTLHTGGGQIIPQRLSDFSRGGAVCVEHLTPFPEICDTLHKSGIERFVINLRDPRQATLSWVHHLMSDEMGASAALLDHRRQELATKSNFEASYLKYLSSWCQYQQKWMEIAKDETKVNILITDFDNLKDDETEFFRSYLDFFHIPERLFDWSVLDASKTERAGHFRKGLRREWEEVLSAETQAQIDPIIAEWPLVNDYVRKKDQLAACQ